MKDFLFAIVHTKAYTLTKAWTDDEQAASKNQRSWHEKYSNYEMLLKTIENKPKKKSYKMA